MSRAVIDPYLKIQAALADDIDGRRQGQRRQHRDRGDRARRAGDEDRHGRRAARRRPTEIEDARDKFGALSEAIDTYMTGLHLKAPEGVKVAFCPMVQKPWLQADATHRQPVLRQEHADLRQLPVNIPFTKHTLDNGLDVLLHEDHACPIVAVNIWYHVGSKNEHAGPHRLRASVRAPDVRGLASTTTTATSSRCRAPARRSTDRPTPIAPTTGKWCRPARSSSRCGWNRIAWATCCRR